MPLQKLCQHLLCRILVFRFDEQISPIIPPPWFLIPPKRCIGTYEDLQNFSEALGKNRSLTALSISVKYSFPAFIPFATGNSPACVFPTGVARDRDCSCDRSRCNEHSWLATIVDWSCFFVLLFIAKLTTCLKADESRRSAKFKDPTAMRRMGNMLKKNTTLKKLKMVCLLFLHVLNSKALNQHRFCLLDKESTWLSMFRNNWKAFGVPATLSGYFRLHFARFFFKLTNKPPSGSFPPLKQCPDLWGMSAMVPLWKKFQSLFFIFFSRCHMLLRSDTTIRWEEKVP